MPSHSQPAISHHPRSSLPTLLRLLRPHLPSSLPLYRRLQFHLVHDSDAQRPVPDRTQPGSAEAHAHALAHAHAHVLASFPPATRALPPRFVVALVDRAKRPETECWVFTSAEIGTCGWREGRALLDGWEKQGQVNGQEGPGREDGRDAVGTRSETERAELRAMMAALFREIRALPLPPPPAAGDHAAPSSFSSQPSTLPLSSASSAPDAASAPSGLTYTTASAAGYARHAHFPHVLLVGSLAAPSLALIHPPELRDGERDEDEDQAGRSFLAEGFVGPEIAYRKYIFRLHREDAKGAAGDVTGLAVGEGGVETGTGRARALGVGTQKPLPPGLRWASLRDADLALVRQRTKIPRQERTLRSLPSVAIFRDRSHLTTTSSSPIDNRAHAAANGTGLHHGGDHDDDDDATAPIAWAFLGQDGSLTSLHVEPAFRGRGLAKAVTLKLFSDVQRRQGIFAAVGSGDEDVGWAHADAAAENRESIGVMESLGGRWGWDVYWVRVDLERVG
ncbi:hypothetical protein B0A49_03750 [Cryomyces minteri]|uniref:GCN5-related N-acetyltransferase Rv2170-like domain-containing protein n=1 Tax=Cryomyces minteri TaxID=331657 RepID=A0A4U0X116_9PEZI|nr:hypothetical protein B0A49_03750 [Cryomyces minteri]